MQILQPSTFHEFEQYYRLRYEMLRMPWHQPLGSERVEDDDTATHLMAINEETGEVMGVARVHMETDTEAQLRFLAVGPKYQNKQIGRQLLHAIEEKARELGAKDLLVQAREYAVNFYKRNGFALEQETYLLFGEIQHYQMRKHL
ncbi:acyltransferase [Rufibacter sp. DG15C]|uniref:GNAT family N-acetyltransferase n=1 Tax=Rufibacter sp. DG15C TaxID=1379909 RepID=UPI00078E0441|nr:GNAT family N-acetyltransferase [Rufibacter sp. DG15C]AMM51262.1 acyltransferase [Rufibacter sp. DG15C]